MSNRPHSSPQRPAVHSAADLDAMVTARPIDWRALMLAVTERELDGMVTRPRMYAASIRELEALFWKTLSDLRFLRAPTRRETFETSVYGLAVVVAARHGIRCGNTSPAYAAPDLTMDQMAEMLLEVWVAGDQAWPLDPLTETTGTEVIP